MAHNGLNAFYTVGDVVDIGLVTATDYRGNPVAATVGVTAPDGGAVTIGEDGRFSAAMEGEYVVTVRYEEENLFLEAVYRFVVQSGKINRKVFAPAENMPLEGNFLDYGEERLRFLSGEGMTYGDDGYALLVNAKEDGCWIDFSILTEKIDLSKIDRITFAIKCFAANATGSQVFLKSNGADRLLARSGNSGAVPMRADVGNIVAGRWCETVSLRIGLRNFSAAPPKCRNSILHQSRNRRRLSIHVLRIRDKFDLRKDGKRGVEGGRKSGPYRGD